MKLAHHWYIYWGTFLESKKPLCVVYHHPSPTSTPTQGPCFNCLNSCTWSEAAKSKGLPMPRACTMVSFIKLWKPSQEAVISKVFIDVKPTTTRQMPLIIALFVGENDVKLQCRKADNGAEDAPHSVRFSFVAVSFWHEWLAICLQLLGADCKMSVWGPGALPFSLFLLCYLLRCFHRPSDSPSGTPRKAFCGNGHCHTLHLSFNGGWRYNWPMVVWKRNHLWAEIEPSLDLEKEECCFQLTPACLTPSGGCCARTRLVRVDYFSPHLCCSYIM